MTSYDRFKQLLFDKTVKLVKKGYIPSYIEEYDHDKGVTEEDIRRQINKISRTDYEMKVAAAKERKIESALEIEDLAERKEAIARLRERNPNRVVADEYLYDVSAAQARSISKMFKEQLDLKVPAQKVRVYAGDRDWEYWDEYSKLYHQMRDGGMTAKEIQSLIWGS